MKHYHCPVNALDCPYFKTENCRCTLENPMEDCEDFAFMWYGCNPDEYTDYDEE